MPCKMIFYARKRAVLLYTVLQHMGVLVPVYGMQKDFSVSIKDVLCLSGEGKWREEAPKRVMGGVTERAARPAGRP